MLSDLKRKIFLVTKENSTLFLKYLKDNGCKPELNKAFYKCLTEDWGYMAANKFERDKNETLFISVYGEHMFGWNFDKKELITLIVKYKDMRYFNYDLRFMRKHNKNKVDLEDL